MKQVYKPKKMAAVHGSAKHNRFTRLLSLLLALVLLQGAVTVPVSSAETEPESSAEAESSVSTESNSQTELPVDEDTLKITLDGEEIAFLTLLSHEKVELKAEGLTEQADYQWQILHPEQEGLWVNIYDATTNSLSVTAALVNNMLDEDGRAALRCCAYTEDYAYLTSIFTVTLCAETAAVMTMSLENGIAVAAEDGAGTDTETDTDTTTPEFVTVTIEYVRYDYFKDENGDFVLSDTGTQAFSPYIATILYNETFDPEPINVPTIVGYNAYLGDGTDVITKVDLTYNTGVTKDQTVTVKYKPANVNYTVRYYFQNIYDDNYVEDTAQTRLLAGPTGSAPSQDAIDAKFVGFTSLYYQPDTIAADGSTVFEVYYERNYYLMEFDCDGGYGADPVYVRYGTYISVPTPVKSGWMFQYWYLLRTVDDDGAETKSTDTDADALPATMPAYNSSYKAVWGRSDTTFTVVYWVENANDDGYSYVASIENVNATTGDVISLDSIGTYTYTTADNSTANVSTVLPVASLADYTEIYEDGIRNAYDKDAEGNLIPYTNSDGTTSNGVLIEGDGSSIFNIYFQRKNYYIKFYYARSYESGNGSTQYEVTATTDGWSKNKNLFEGNGWISAGDIPILDEQYKTGIDELPVGNPTHKYYYILLKAKYGENIQSEWPYAPVTNCLGSGAANELLRKFVSWGTQNGSGYYNNHANKNIKGPYSRMDAELIIANGAYDDEIGAYEAQTMLAYWAMAPTPWTYNVYVAVYSGEDTTGKTIKNYNGTEYYLYESYTPILSTDSSVDGQTAVSVEGLNFSNQRDGSTGTANFYFTRNGHTLKFNNYGETHKAETVYYGEPLAAKLVAAGTPQYPSTLEPGAYEFVGWFTGPMGTGNQVKADTSLTMEDSDLILFAYWKPVVHKVTFYTLYTDIGDDTAIPFISTQNVEHGKLLETAHGAQIPAREGYRFIGWFYMDENGKKRFAPDSMEVVQDLDLFAEWQSDIDTTYKVTYVYTNADGNVVEIAASTEGHSTAGKTKTFHAKGVTELYKDYQTGYFPKAGSHSILMMEDPAENKYAFEYVYDAKVHYKVLYVDYSTKLEIADPKEESTDKAVITERFLPITGYVPMPGYYYQRKSLSSDENADSAIEENVIIFYYMKDKDHGPYSIEYYLENLDGTYTQATSIVNTADIGTTLTAEIFSFDGYEYQPSKNVVITYSVSKDTEGKTVVTENKLVGKAAGDPPRHKIDANGLTIQIYYDRKTYSYRIEYREYGAGATDSALKTITNDPGSAKFGTTITHTAEASFKLGDIVYEYYIPDTSNEQRTKEMEIRAFSDGETNPNVMVFYYTQKQYTVCYEAVCTDPNLKDFGKVSPSSQIVTTASQLQATAMPYKGYRFVGWYKDEVCTQKIDNSKWVTGTTLTPKEITETTYYALFEPITTDLTITKNAAEGTNLGNDSFLFSVVGQDNNNKYINLTTYICGESSVTISNLPIGTYTITELTNWSWEYTADSPAKKVTTVENQTNTVAFTNTYADPDWLGGEGSKNNRFSGVYRQTTN